jgi:hypothetical protein
MACSFAFAIPVLPDDKLPDLCRQAFPLAPKVHQHGDNIHFSGSLHFKFLKPFASEASAAANLVIAMPLGSALWPLHSLINSVAVSLWIGLSVS